ncbi:hypothetical protein [Thiocystis violacea]|uniref:hypothetical protein n=1 Tax=Thiocystis violacea TaxID=13725 RepID=UPI001908BB0E|nr:hypothetical protein [Thiocystis violacea]
MDNQKQTWSDNLKKQTREIIDAHGTDSVLPDLKLHMKNISSRYGYIEIENLLKGVVKVVDKETGCEVLFKNTDDLISAGWVID